MKRRFFVEQFLTEDYMHGGIGCVDAERVLLAKGFAPISFPYHRGFSLWAKIGRVLFLLRTFLAMRDATVVFLFPLYANLPRLLVKWLRRKRTVELICMIADINGLKDGNDQLLRKEINFLKRFRYFVVHNDNMKEWVRSTISPNAVISEIEFFDFITQPVNDGRSLSNDIVFAGNLAKSTFLEKLNRIVEIGPSIHFNLYGPGKTEPMLSQKNVHWAGMEKPYQLPQKLEGSFGLLWDGDDADQPGGSLGNYMHYISHHKLSLYILSKLPIIAPAMAGSAALIEKYKIGILVNSLKEVEAKISNLPIEEYRQMQNNMIPLAEKISQGECLSHALDEILKRLD